MMLSQDERRGLIAQYAEGYDAIMAALVGITEAEWEAREAPGEWNPREIVHHMGDSEMITSVGFRLFIATNNSPAIEYDQDHLAQVLRYDRPIEESLEAFRFARSSTLPLLQSMTDEEWQHVGIRPDGRMISAETMLTWYGPHAHKHAEQILRARATISNVSRSDLGRLTTTTEAGRVTRALSTPPTRYHAVIIYQAILCDECAQECPELHPALANLTISTQSVPYCHICAVRIERSQSPGVGNAQRALDPTPTRYQAVQVHQVTLCRDCAERNLEIHPVPAHVTTISEHTPYCHICAVRI